MSESRLYPSRERKPVNRMSQYTSLKFKLRLSEFRTQTREWDIPMHELERRSNVKTVTGNVTPVTNRPGPPDRRFGLQVGHCGQCHVTVCTRPSRRHRRLLGFPRDGAAAIQSQSQSVITSRPLGYPRDAGRDVSFPGLPSFRYHRFTICKLFQEKQAGSSSVPSLYY